EEEEVASGVPDVPADGVPPVIATPLPKIEPAAGSVTVPSQAQPEGQKAPATPSLGRLSAFGGLRTAAVVAAAALPAATSFAISFRYLGTAPGAVIGPASQGQLFDPNIIPLLTNSDRRDVARYAALPGPKALAISADGWGVASNAPDLESAKKEALERCSTHS